MINAERMRRDIIVIGASAGGFQAVSSLLEMIPGGLEAIVGLVLHRSPLYESRLGWLLGQRTDLKVVEPDDTTAVLPSVLLIAPRDQHMVFANGHVRLNRGPKEHRTRPAIDPLFRSAAAVYGPRTVGVLLSGTGGDGTAGLSAIEAAGGIALVQHPAEAQFPTMPVRAIRDDEVDGVFRLTELAHALIALVRGEAFGER